MDYAIELSGLTKQYDGFLLDHIDLKLPCGSIMGFIGENGAGKSTTIKLILDLIRKDAGEIKILGKNQSELTLDSKEDIGVVMDDCCFPEVMTVTGIGSVMAKIYRNWNKAQYASLIKSFSLPTKKSVKELSKGMKMKLNIACALSHNAKLLILDEATSGLDPVVRDEILSLFMDFIQDETHSILMSSHITSDLEKVCDYVTLIHKGHLILSKPKDELLETYGVVKCSMEELKQLPSDSVIRYRKNEFGVEALVIKNKVTRSVIMDRATIEDIMLFHIRGMVL